MKTILMIDSALRLLRDELSSYLLSKSRGNIPIPIVIENVAMLETEGSLLEDSVIISLINIEEENAFKSAKTLMNPTISDSNQVSYEKRPTYLNLYILFCANFKGGETPREKYLDAIKLLSNIIQFFQVKNYFSMQNSPKLSALGEKEIIGNPDANFDNFKLTMDLYSLTLEQINHLWGSLGGKQLPFVMYRARMVELEDRQIDQVGKLITTIDSKEEVL